ncbi:MAG: proteasome accessory factor PafA2 [Actinobacteria bacterium]|nr:MAG: proteasome accessory factor PafA2 [Actinomycetota bacterium]
MAIPKVCGIETEYGIIFKGGDVNPITASSIIVNAFSQGVHDSVGWDFIDEHPGSDARGFSLDDYLFPEFESQLVNTVLTNGARYYVDHAHPEISTPECRTALETVLFDRAGEEIVRRSMQIANEGLPFESEIVLYKNNSDGKGNSYGCHENYLVSRTTPFAQIAQQITTHFVSRQIFCGAGKVGVEHRGIAAKGNSSPWFQLSQRADFFEEEIGLETTLKRPIVNTRDEPHCDPVKYRRLHVIAGDANMSEVATFLKVGTTAIVLAMIEDDEFPEHLVISDPVSAVRQISHDYSLQTAVVMSDGRRLTALQIQFELYEAAVQYAARYGLEAVDQSVGQDVLLRWQHVLLGLKSDPMSVANVVDWVAKLRIVEGFTLRHGLQHDDARLKAIDLQYHDMRVDKCLALRAGLEVLCETDEVLRSMSQPPSSTRAFFRGTVLQRWPHAVIAANWDSVVFDIDNEGLKRVPMPEPLRGTKVLVGELLAMCQTPADLLARIGSQF